MSVGVVVYLKIALKMTTGDHKTDNSYHMTADTMNYNDRVSDEGLSEGWLSWLTGLSPIGKLNSGAAASS